MCGGGDWGEGGLELDGGVILRGLGCGFDCGGYGVSLFWVGISGVEMWEVDGCEGVFRR